VEEEQQPQKTNQLNKLKSKKLLGAFAVFLILAVLGAVFFVTRQKTAQVTDNGIASSDLPKLSPEDVGMVVTLRSDKKALMFEITNSDDIQRIEYTIEYKAQTDEGIANQGILGEMNIAEDGITKTDFREFGTCSAGKCRYDNVISDITIALKVTKKTGKDYQVTKVVKL